MRCLFPLPPLSSALLKTSLLFAAYGVVSISLTLINKSLALAYPHPWTTVLVQNSGALVCTATLLVCRVQALRPVRRSHILPGFVNAIWMVMVIWSSLRALHYVPVPIYVVACNARPACTAILEFLVLGKTVPIDRAAALTIIVVGYVIATMSDFAWEGDGVGYAFLYTFLVGGLSVYEHAIMCKLKKEQTPIGLNLYRLVLSLPFLAVMIGVSGEASIAALPLLEGGGLLLIASSVLCLAIGVLMFELQLRASATSMQVFNTVAKFLTTMVSLVTHPADISLSAWTGYFLCVMGFLLYTFGVPRLRPRNKEPLEFDRVFESKGQDGR
ncbi:hypothetical protein FOZ60_000638 [Perkinsus olseni]|uniref:Sugar phosphate transporter domain-containing protein n=1 Tax=Perkinsus olseni TaxID=32597 RepID=A0A7J6P2U9_PEROL|nr:hypothetical protein FOZ60_000638 [Perkinsus olseni]